MKRDDQMEFRLLDMALGSVGIYPQATVKDDGIRVERTEWQNGWNECHLTILNRWIELSNLRNNLNISLQTAFDNLVEADVLRFSHNSDGSSFWLSMNDTFAFACSDSEDISMAELPEIAEIWRKYGHDGLTAWAANKRKQQPLQCWQTEKYRAALKELEVR